MQISAKHILVESLNTAVTLKEKINLGEDFSTLAELHSTCPSSRNGGNLGSFSRGQMVQPFENVAFSSEIGQLCGPVQTQFGYHLILRTA